VPEEVDVAEQHVSLLIVGGDSDPNTQRIVDQAHLRGLDYVFWDTDCEGSEVRQVAWDLSEPVIDLSDRRIRPAAVFLRYNVFREDSDGNAYAVHDTVESFALAWSDIGLLNRRTLGAVNNKSRNLVLARRCGFAIPETTVLADLSPLIRHPAADRVIIKPLAGGDHASLVADAIVDSERLATLPPQFVQEKLDGENLRVFSIGGDLFGFHLQTDQIDYRTDDNVLVRAIDVPSQLTDAVSALVERLGFDYCALDFRCRRGFEAPVFLEINSFPMFVAFDDASENRLADAILEFLV